MTFRVLNLTNQHDSLKLRVSNGLPLQRATRRCSRERQARGVFLRRVRKSTRGGVHTYFYDGWNLVLELIEHDGVTDRIEYVWGKDISGTLQGAGGIGGLLYVKVNGAIYIPYYDAYGNILGYYDAAGNIVATYTYDAFGRTISQSGALADVFVFRYSTKYFDRETGLYYYGMRYYSPALRRWLTRDPIEEDGGMNLYAFCNNSANFMFDRIGQKSFNFMWRDPTSDERSKINSALLRIDNMASEYLKAIKYFRDNYFIQSRGMANVWMSHAELDRSADVSKLPAKLTEHFDLAMHKSRGTLNMALTQIENRLIKQKRIRNYDKWKVSTCRNVFCELNLIDALKTPGFIGLCKKSLDEMNEYELCTLLGHEASHMFHMTQDYYYLFWDKKIYDAYAWGMIFE